MHCLDCATCLYLAGENASLIYALLKIKTARVGHKSSTVEYPLPRVCISRVCISIHKERLLTSLISGRVLVLNDDPPPDGRLPIGLHGQREQGPKLVHLPAQPDPFCQRHETFQQFHTKCSHEAEKWMSASVSEFLQHAGGVKGFNSSTSHLIEPYSSLTSPNVHQLRSREADKCTCV